MLKLNKSVHFNILTIFAIVFVCVYLYYTISDVKKIAIEVKKHSQDIANMITSLTTLSKEMADLKKKPMTPVSSATVGKMNITPQITISPVMPSKTDGGSTDATNVSTEEHVAFNNYETDEVDETEETDETADEEVESSVGTEDVKNLLNDMPEDDDCSEDNDDVNEVLELSMAPTNVDPVVVEKSMKSMTPEQLKSESYDDLKKYCKDNGLSTKGKKDELIQRILSV
jgi:hypothetical protein